MDPTRRDAFAAPVASMMPDDKIDQLVKAMALLQKELTETNDRVSWLSQFATPIGTLAPFAGGVVPEGWLLCDGSVLDPKAKPEFAELARVIDTVFDPERKVVKLPDLQGRLPRGKSGPEAIGTRGGADQSAVQTAAAGKHAHGLPGVTGGISNADKPPLGGDRYFVHDNNKKWANTNWLSTESGGPQPEGQHRHDFGGNTGETPDHQHTVTVPIIPSYVAVTYIIKYRAKK